MRKHELLAAIQREIHRHDFGTFIENPPSVAQDGEGAVVPGCSTCRVRLHSMDQFLDHLANDAMPALLERLSKAKS